jgi:hypothetical protein
MSSTVDPNTGGMSHDPGYSHDPAGDDVFDDMMDDQ